MDKIYAELPEEIEKNVKEDNWGGKTLRFLLRRYPVWPIVKFLSEKKVPQHRHTIWYTLGSLALFFIAVQFVTGILLMIYYQPSQPWSSVQRIVNEIPFGNVIRSIHHWGANLMVLVVFVHFFSTFFMKAYRRPREFTWLSGLALLGMTLFFGFSGYLLAWDELAFFATRIGISEIEKAPVMGPWLGELVRGGSDVSLATIGRFFTLHVVVLPLLLLSVVGVHLLFIQIQGMSAPDSFNALPESEKRYHKFFPDYLLGEVPIWLLTFAILIGLAVIFPRELGPEASVAAAAPEGIKPEWYFLAQYQALKLFPGNLELVGLVLISLTSFIWVIVPFIDREIPAVKIGRIVTLAGILGVLGLIGFTTWGWLS